MVKTECIEAVEKRLGVKAVSKGAVRVYTNAKGKALGRLYFLANSSFKCQCSVHTDCSMFCAVYNAQGEVLRAYTDVMRKMVEWVALGPVHDRAGHQAEAVAVKESLGILVRTTKRAPTPAAASGSSASAGTAAATASRPGGTSSASFGSAAGPGSSGSSGTAAATASRAGGPFSAGSGRRAAGSGSSGSSPCPAPQGYYKGKGRGKISSNAPAVRAPAPQTPTSVYRSTAANAAAFGAAEARRPVP